MTGYANAQRLFTVEQTQSTTDDVYTPRWIFDRLAITFDLDVAAPPGGVPWIPAARQYTMADDGLTSPWEGRVWMNPPYSEPGPWVDRWLAHGNGIAIVCTSKAMWYGRLWDSEAVLHTPRDPGSNQLKFVKNGVRNHGIYMPVVMAALGDECIEALHRLGRCR